MKHIDLVAVITVSSFVYHILKLSNMYIPMKVRGQKQVKTYHYNVTFLGSRLPGRRIVTCCHPRCNIQPAKSGFLTIVPARFMSSNDKDGNDPTKSSDGQKKTSKSGKSSDGGDKGDGTKGTQWWCPKCGDPCTHVDNFVCKWYEYCNVFVCDLKVIKSETNQITTNKIHGNKTNFLKGYWLSFNSVARSLGVDYTWESWHLSAVGSVMYRFSLFW